MRSCEEKRENNKHKSPTSAYEWEGKEVSGMEEMSCGYHTGKHFPLILQEDGEGAWRHHALSVYTLLIFL